MLRASSPPRRDSRSFDLASSLNGLKENRRAGSSAGVTLVFNFLQKFLAVKKRTTKRKSYHPVDRPGVTLELSILHVLLDRNSYLLKPYYMCKLKKVFRASGPPRRDSRSLDCASSLDGEKEIGVPVVSPGVALVFKVLQNLRAVKKRANQTKNYKPVDPLGVTLDLWILQVLTGWNLRNIGVPVVPPGVTLVFSIWQKLQHVLIKEYIASQ